MGHKHNQHRKKKRKGGNHKRHHDTPAKNPTAAQRCIELVLKCNSEGSREAIISSIENIKIPGLRLSIISSGVGEISKSDLFMAGTAARLHCRL